MMNSGPTSGEKRGLIGRIVGQYVAATTSVFAGLRWRGRSLTQGGDQRPLQTEECLGKDQRDHRELLDAMKEGFALCEMIYDADGKPVDFRYLEVNPAFARLTGLTIEQVVGRTVREANPAIEPFWIEAYGRIVASGRSELIDQPVAGLGKHFEVRAWRVAPGRFAAIFSDVTARHAADEALRESEEQAHAFFDRAGVAAAQLDADQRLVRVNDQYCRFTGYSREELIGKHPADMDHPAEEGSDREQLRLWYDGHLPIYEIEKRYVRKDGQVVWGHVTAVLIRDADGRPYRTAAIVQDVTQRRRAEEALRESEQRLRGIFDNAGVGIAEVGPDDRFTAANDRVCDILGRTRQQLLTMSVRELTSPEDRAISDRLNAEIHAGQRDSADYEKRYLRGDGSRVWVHAIVSAIRDGQGRWMRGIATIEDISRRKAVEEEITAARISAETAKAAAEQANHAKDQFLAVLSHELRTPLTPVLVTVSTLQEDSRFDTDTRKSLEVIRRNVELQARLIDDLLDVTRIVQGKVELDKKPVSLGEIISHAVDVCRSDIEARGLDFVSNVGNCGPCMVHADATRLQQVFWNLVKNAIKFTPRGGRLAIRCSCVGSSVITEVADTGKGIDPAVLPGIFNAFEQGGVGVTRQFGGLGLGLTIARAMVQMHGGEIAAHSEGKGKGATFVVRLPLIRAASQDKGTPAAAGGSPAVVPIAASPLRILLVDDDPDTTRAISRLLESRGHRVRTAGDLATALAAGEAETFDLLLTDMGLPDGSGLDLLRELRRRGQALPAVALSGYGQEADLRRSRDAGFARHLVKPVDAHRLLATLAEVTAGQTSVPENKPGIQPASASSDGLAPPPAPR